MSDSVTVIDIVAQVTDDTTSGAKSATDNVSKLERSMMNLQKQIQGMKGKSKLEVAATLKDMASKGIQNVTATGKKIAGKVWTVTLKAVDLVTAPFKKVWGLISNPIMQVAAFAGISLGVADTVNTFKDFEQGMANVKAISGATGSEFDELTTTAKKLGESTMFSAAQAAEAMENLAMAGWKSKDIVAGMPGLLDLAAAGSVDLATAADVTSSALAQFNMGADEAQRVADVLAATATNSKTDIAGLGESLKMAGTQAGALGYSIEDTALAIGLMGNAGVDASSAGTALRSVLARMSKQEGMSTEESNAMAEAMKKVGVSMTDSQGKSKSLMTVMKELRKGFQGMTEVEKASTAANLAGMYAQSGLLAIVNASDEKFEELAAAIGDANGAAAEMAKTKMDTLQGSLYYLQSAAEGVKIAIGEKLQPYVRGLVDWITAHMPDIQNAVGAAVDFVTGKIDSIIASVKSLTTSEEWKNTETLWDKIKLAWEKLIAEPFDAWWNGTGKTWLAEKANSIGEGLGNALKSGILTLLGVDIGGAVTDGVSIGKSFADGFLEGFDGKKVGEAIWKAIKSGTKSLVSDAATLLPGGKEASSTSGLSAAVLGYGAFKTAKAGYSIYKGGKAVVNGTKAVGSALGSVTGISEGIQIAKAAKAGGSAAQSALAMAQNGTLGTGAKIGAKMVDSAGKIGQVASKVAVPLAAVTSAIEMGVDAYHGVEKAKEWTGSDSIGNKVASGIGAALGGTGDGIWGEESIGRKTLNVGGGALKGAGIGAAVGSIIPGVGTAIGGGVGALVGGVGAAIGGENIAKALSTAGTAIKGFFTETIPGKFGEFADGTKGFFDNSIAPAITTAGTTVKGFFTETIPGKFDEFVNGVKGFFDHSIAPAIMTAGTAVKGFFTETIPSKFGEFANGVKGFFTETVPQALSSTGDTISGFFTETVPTKFEELVNGVGTFFTQIVPFAIGYAAGKVQVFFTETIPEFFGNLWGGITNFFMTTVPAATEMVKSTLSTFFTETMPTFFVGLWDGVIGFFTGTIPSAIKAVGSAVMVFFMETVPQFFRNLWAGITDFFTETVQPAIETVGSAISTFFMETIPTFFIGLWDSVVGFFTGTIPSAIKTVGSAVTAFFTEIVPQFFRNLWVGITGFFTKTVQPAIETVGNAVNTFFTETVPKFFTGLWKGIMGFFTETIPNTLESIGATLHTFFIETIPNKVKEIWDGILGFFIKTIPDAVETIKEGVTEFFGGIKEKLGGLWSKIKGFFGSAAESASAGYSAATDGTQKHAEGGIMTRPHVGLVAEDGAEAIIPLSGKRRERGIDLWKKTGRILGVKPYAEGGIVGVLEGKQKTAKDSAEAIIPLFGNEETTTTTTGNGITVTIGTLTFEIHVDGGSAPDTQLLVAAIKENIHSMTNEIAYQLAIAIQQAFANTPKASWRG